MWGSSPLVGFRFLAYIVPLLSPHLLLLIFLSVLLYFLSFGRLARRYPLPISEQYYGNCDLPQYTYMVRNLAFSQGALLLVIGLLRCGES